MPGKLGGAEDANQDPQFACKSQEPQSWVSAGSLTTVCLRAGHRTEVMLPDRAVKV